MSIEAGPMAVSKPSSHGSQDGKRMSFALHPTCQWGPSRLPTARVAEGEARPTGLLLQNTRNATTIAMAARVKEMLSTQRTTPVVSPCRALVAVSIWGCRSDMRHPNATAGAEFPC